MNLEERNTGNKKSNNFRSILNIGIGCLYILLGGYVIYVKAFGTMELAPGTAYTLGSIVILYGIFRIWRGFADIKQKSEKRDMRRDFPSLHGMDDKE